jgi:hypothetical protein
LINISIYLQPKCTVVYALRRGGNEIQQLTVQQVKSTAETADQGPRIQAVLMPFLIPILHTAWLDNHALTLKRNSQNIISMKNPDYCILS